MRIGILDSDLFRGTRFPNLALMKISSYYKERGHEVELILDYDQSVEFDKIFLAKVFSKTLVPGWFLMNAICGGTGLDYTKEKTLPNKIEHIYPDYGLYDEFVEQQIKKCVGYGSLKYYIDYSLGFTTRGCFRKCEFCVNKKYDKVLRHSPVSEFLNRKKKFICLLDDNILGYSNWEEVLDELNNTGKPFEFKQGVDIRLMTKRKAIALESSNYKGGFFFAFDNIADKDLIDRKLAIWREVHDKIDVAYVLCGFYSQDVDDIISTFERIKILISHKTLPYIMRHENYAKSWHRGMYINLARWCNQQNAFKKLSFREFCEHFGKDSSTYRYMVDFEKQHPDVAKTYFGIKW
jgi:hypothetical protein